MKKINQLTLLILRVLEFILWPKVTEKKATTIIKSVEIKKMLEIKQTKKFVGLPDKMWELKPGLRDF